MKPEILRKLQEFIDDYETEYGDIEGFEVKLEHPIIDGERQDFANIKELVVIHLKLEVIDLK
jgi:hypothetical protein